jgi:hypothetical protein
MAYIPYGRQDISDEDIQAVVEVLKSVLNLNHWWLKFVEPNMQLQ